MPAATLDWAAVKAEYVGSEETLSAEKLARKYKVQPTTVKRHMKSERWVDERRLYRDRVASKTLERASTVQSEVRARMLSQGRLMGDIGMARLGRLAREVQADPAKIEQLSITDARLMVMAGTELQRDAAGIAVEEDAGRVATIVIELPPGDIEDGE